MRAVFNVTPICGETELTVLRVMFVAIWLVIFNCLAWTFLAQRSHAIWWLGIVLIVSVPLSWYLGWRREIGPTGVILHYDK